MMSQIEGDICVLGGGPAGSVIARRLAELGHETLLVDRTAHVMRMRAESLAPSIIPVLDSLNVRCLIDAAVFCREERALLLWESDVLQEKSFGAAPSLLVERAFFDKLLREELPIAGVRLIAPANARSPKRIPSGGWLVPVVTSNGPTSIRTKFLVDARGKRHRARTDGSAPRTAALSASWSLRNEAFAETRIEAGRDEWFWGNPLPDRLYAATLFLDSARVAGLDRDRRTRLYRHLLSRSKLLGNLLRGKMIEPPSVRDATSGIANDLIGDDFIRVGEAAVSIDPLSSQGIQVALLSAIQGSAAVHTILTPTHDPVPAFEFYRERQQRAEIRGRQNAARLYQARAGNRSGAFWDRRSPVAGGASAKKEQEPPALISLSSSLRISQALRIIEVPLLSGPFITRARGLSHPGLENPIAYLGDVALVPLIDEAAGALTTDQILRRWTRRMAPEIAWNIMNWMYAVQILVPYGSAPS